MLNKKVPAPFKPRVRDEMDVGNFAEEFTTMAPVDSPAFPPQSAKRFAQIFRVIFTKIQRFKRKSLFLSIKNVFQGFSFVAPSVLFNAECFADSAAKLCGTQVKPVNNHLSLSHVS